MGDLIHKTLVAIAMTCATLLVAFVVGAVVLFNLNPAACVIVLPYALCWFILWMESK